MQFHYCMHCQEYHQLKSPSILIFSVTDSPISTGRSTAGATTMLMTITSSPGVSVVLIIGAVIGGVAGASLVLTLLLLLLTLIWMTKKYKGAANFPHQQEQPEGKEQRKAVHQQLHQYDKAMEMKNNDAYISTTRQIPTEDNVAYGQIESDHNLLSDQCEYDYI